MAQRTRYSSRDAEGDERPARRTPAKSGPPIGPILVLVVLLGGALLAARMIAEARDGTEAAPAQPERPPEPFADLPEEVPPQRAGGSEPYESSRPVESAPSGMLAGRTEWRNALERATEAEVLFQAASEAKAANDHERFREKGIAAKKLFSRILEETYLFEEELLEEYGDRDPQVREVVRKRTHWTNRLSALSKTTGR